MIGRLHHARLRVADVDEASARWARLYGLSPAGPGLLRCAYEDFALELRRSDIAPGLEHVGYELRAGVRLEDVGAAPQVSAQTLHVALAMPEEEAERAVASGDYGPAEARS